MDDLAAQFTRDLSAGSPGRSTVPAAAVWGAIDAVGGTVSGAVARQDADGMTFDVAIITATGTPAAPVAPGAAKPEGATVTIESKAIEKVAAQATVNAEAIWSSAGLVGSLATTLGSQCIAALDGQAVAALDAAVAESTPAGTWLAGLVAGQAAVATRGGRPSLAVISAVDWPVFVTELSAAAGLTNPTSDALFEVAGSRIVVAGAAPAGEGFVLDPDAAITVVREFGALVDPYSSADVNKVRVVVDLVASFFVTNPSHVAAFAK